MIRETLVMAAVAACAVAATAAEVSTPRHAVVAADSNRVVRFDRTGRIVWQLDDIGPVHRIQPLENGNILTQDGWTRLIEIDPQQQIVWSYDAAAQEGVDARTVEVHAFQRLADGNTLVVENGNGRIIEVDRDGRIVHRLPYRVAELSPHHDVRQARKLVNGHYLLCHEAEGRVTEYAPDGEIVWDYEVPLFDKPRAKGHGATAWGNQCFHALRLLNGNTLISTGNGHAVIEVTPEKQIVWSVHQNDLQGITLAWTTSLEVLPGGNILIGNCHAGPEQPQLIEVDRDRNVVWTFHDFAVLGNSTAATATVGVEGVLR
jgi:hypothetical protein